MRFENTKCDGCGRTFEKDDDIVVCPVCGTPQHRECYDANGGCVNSAKHENGFEWNLPDSTDDKHEEKSDEPLIPCPACGHMNKPDSEQCERCGQKFKIFGFNVAKEKAKLDEEEKEQPQMSMMSENGEIPDIEQLIEERVKALAPGILPEQRKEQLCGHSIADTISFIGNSASVYVKKFRKREHEHKFTFNWAAFIFSPLWFFWRKLYKAGIVFLTLLVSLTLLMAGPSAQLVSIYNGIIQSSVEAITEAQMAELTSAMMLVLPFEAAIFLIHLISGFIADKMYWKYCKNSLDSIDRMRISDDNISTIRYYLKRSSTAFAATLIASALYYILPSLLMSLFSA